MSGKRAKQIRREVYGEQSLRGERWYIKVSGRTCRLHPQDLRSIYQIFKKQHKDAA